MNIHVLKRCVTCATVYAFERGTKDSRDVMKKCERVVSVSYGEEGLEYATCKGDLEMVNT